jgi:hypothetical protein
MTLVDRRAFVMDRLDILREVAAIERDWGVLETLGAAEPLEDVRRRLAVVRETVLRQLFACLNPPNQVLH